MSSNSGVTVKVEGFRELARDFRRMGPEARKDLRSALKPAGELVRDEARRIAGEKGLRITGTLIRRISVAVTSRYVAVEARAVRQNDRTRFNYPRRYEYGSGGRRAFLGPALEHKGAQAADMVFRAFDDLAGKYGFRNTRHPE